VLYTDRLSEAASWGWLGVLVVGHVLWWAASWACLVRARAAGRPALAEGEAVVQGRLLGDGVVLVGEPFALLTDDGERVQVEADVTTRARTATVRPWDDVGRLHPGERLAVTGELAREAVDGADGYRAARSRWLLRARFVEDAERAVPQARAARVARIAMALAALSTGALAWGAWDFVVLSLSGEPAVGTIDVAARNHTGVVPRYTGSAWVTTQERTAQVRIAHAGGRIVLEERLTEGGYRALLGQTEAPVVVSDRLGIAIAQLGARPGIPALLPYLGLAEVAGLLFALWMARESAQRLGTGRAAG
jgi:hypothetical protein